MLGLYVYINQLISLVGRVLANGLGNLGSIPGRVTPKTLKIVLGNPYLTLSNIRYVSKIKWSNLGEGVAPSPTPQFSKLLKREPSGRSRLQSSIFFIYICLYRWIWLLNFYSFRVTRLNPNWTYACRLFVHLSFFFKLLFLYLYLFQFFLWLRIFHLC